MLDCSALDWEALEEFPPADSAAQPDSGRPPVWLALDEIGDPVSPPICIIPAEVEPWRLLFLHQLPLPSGNLLAVICMICMICKNM